MTRLVVLTLQRGGVMRVFFAVGIVICSLSFSSFPASAATVDSIQGQVLVQRGEGYRRVTAVADVKVGDSIVANPGSSARVKYPDGCIVKVEPGSAVTITPRSPCKMGAPSGSLEPPPVTQPPPTDWTLVGGALVVGGGIAAVILLIDKDDDKPASPH